MSVNVLVGIANVIACAAVGCILWWTYGRVHSNPLKVIIAIGTALLGYVIYFLVQIVGEKWYPAARGVNGHTIIYDIHIFPLLVVVVVVVIFLSRKGTTTVARQ